MPRLFVTEITEHGVSGTLDGASGEAVLAASLDATPTEPPQIKAGGAFTLRLDPSTVRHGQVLAIWLATDPSVHVCVPLHLGSGEVHSLSDEVRLLRAELELVKTALRRNLRP